MPKVRVEVSAEYSLFPYPGETTESLIGLERRYLWDELRTLFLAGAVVNLEIKEIKGGPKEDANRNT